MLIWGFQRVCTVDAVLFKFEQDSLYIYCYINVMYWKVVLVNLRIWGALLFSQVNVFFLFFIASWIIINNCIVKYTKKTRCSNSQKRKENIITVNNLFCVHSLVIIITQFVNGLRLLVRMRMYAFPWFFLLRIYVYIKYTIIHTWHETKRTCSIPRKEMVFEH